MVVVTFDGKDLPPGAGAIPNPAGNAEAAA